MKILSAITFLTFFFLYSCDTNQSPDSRNPGISSIDSLFNAYFEFKLRINPIEATKGGDFRYNDKVANYISDKYQQDVKDNYSNFLKIASSFKNEKLSEANRLSLQVLQWDARIKKEGLENNIVTIASPMYDLPTFELMPIAQITSLQLYFSQLAAGGSIQPFETVQDYHNWLHRIDEYLVWIDTTIEKMKEGMSQDIVMPKVLIRRVISQLEPFINTPVLDHLFYAPIRQMPDEFTTIDRDPLTDAYRDMIVKKLVPKYRELSDFLNNQYLPSGRETSGIGALPHGPETYNYLIRLHTSTDMTADEIFELGQTEVARIEKEMEKVKGQIGFNGDLRAFLDHVRSNPKLMPFNSPEEVIANFNNIHERMKLKLSELFQLTPKAGFEVRRTEAFREQSASAEYVPGSKDATRPGTFYIPLPDVRSHNVFMDEALFLHEAIPGHHYQLSLQQENENLPAFLHAEGMGVFVEGWALYAESLGKELGLYQDPYQYFGMLSMEMHRAIRLVVDAGIHARGWTREEAIQYSLEHEADSEASITSEIERYMATPGQALSYKIGQLTIRDLRNKAEKKLGSAFSVREFHNQVLNSGSLPMSLLQEKIDRWILKQLENKN